MRAFKTKFLMAAAGATALLALGMGSPATAADFELKYTDHDPLGGVRTDFVKNVFLPEIEKQSGGKIEVEDFWGGALMGSKEVLNGIGDGVADFGYVYPGHYPRQLIAHSVYNLFPQGPKKFSDIVKLYRRIYDEVPELKEELAKAGVMPLMIGAGLPGAFTGVNPLKSIEDVKGDKWRAGDKWKLKFLENIGAVPVAVPWGDVYVALQTGTIDGCFTNYDGIHLMKFDEVAPNLLISKALWYAVPFIHVMNLDKFNSLPKEEQDALLKAAKIAEEKFDAVYEAAFDKIRAEQEAAGFTVTEMSDSDINTWASTDNLTQLQDQWVAESEEAGLKTAAQVMDKVRAIMKDTLAE